MMARLDNDLVSALRRDDDRAGPAAPAHYTAPARLQPFPDASSSLLDRDGKAIYASPGPGTYDFPTQFTPVRTKYERKGAVLATLSPLSLTHGLDKYEAKVINNSGNHVFSKAPAYSFGLRASEGKVFISSAHVEDRRGTQSPAPKYDARGRFMPQSAKFGSAERSQEEHRYLSAQHAVSTNYGISSPGPAYLTGSGRGIAGTLGDAPEWRFTSGPRAAVVNRDAPRTPGPGEYPVAVPKTQLGGRFSPAKSRPSSTHRRMAEKLLISPSHYAHDNPEWRVNPGPGAYLNDDADADVLRQVMTLSAPGSPRSTRHRSDSPTLDDDALRCIRDRKKLNPDFTKARKSVDGVHAPYFLEGLLQRGTTDALYDTRKEWASELEKNTRKREDRKETFGTAPRAFHPERGGNAGGPLISQAHSALTMVCNAESPGPMYETGKYSDLGRGKGVKFPKERRPLGDNAKIETAGPGPGEYVLSVTPSPGVKIAHRFRNPREAKVDPDAPGPNHYRIPTTVRAPSPVRAQSPTQKRIGTFGYCKDRLSFVHPTPSPGPGANYPSLSSPESFGASMGSELGRTGSSRGRPLSPGDEAAARRARAMVKGASMGVKTRTIVQYLSPGHALSEKRGMHSPGPKYKPGDLSKPSTLGPKGGKDPSRPRSTFGFGARDKGVYMGRAFQNLADPGPVPGPGSYDVHLMDTAKVRYKAEEGTRFGTSTRPTLATIKL